MTLMRVHCVIEPLCQATMGWIPSLECLLAGVRESQWLRLVMSDIKCPRRPRMSALESFAWDRRLPGEAIEVIDCTVLGHKEELYWADRWQYLAHPSLLTWDKMAGTSRTQV
jgi:hypothetical protein